LEWIGWGENKKEIERKTGREKFIEMIGDVMKNKRVIERKMA